MFAMNIQKYMYFSSNSYMLFGTDISRRDCLNYMVAQVLAFEEPTWFSVVVEQF